MKTTGIVRGIDALGRIVLPKELRTSMRLDSDAKLEIFVEGDSIILKKYRPNGSCDLCSTRATASARPAAARSAPCKQHLERSRVP